jgi:hypothetical protein
LNIIGTAALLALELMHCCPAIPKKLSTQLRQVARWDEKGGTLFK